MWCSRTPCVVSFLLCVYNLLTIKITRRLSLSLSPPYSIHREAARKWLILNKTSALYVYTQGKTSRSGAWVLRATRAAYSKLSAWWEGIVQHIMRAPKRCGRWWRLCTAPPLQSTKKKICKTKNWKEQARKKKTLQWAQTLSLPAERETPLTYYCNLVIIIISFSFYILHSLCEFHYYYCCYYYYQSLISLNYPLARAV